MSLISLIIDNGYPMIVGDRAISDQGKLSTIVLPSTNRLTVTPTPVVEFNIKTIIVQDILCVGFAGDVPIIEALVVEIRDFFLHRKVTLASLAELFHSLQSATRCAAIFVLPVMGEDRFVVLRLGEWSIAESGEVMLVSAGSGAKDWGTNFLQTYPYLTEKEFTPLFYRQRVLNTCMKFMLNERVTAQTLLDGWGGGFDLVYFQDGKFKRLNNLAYVFYVIDMAKSNPNPVPISIVHQQYVNGKVLVTHFESEGLETYNFAEFGDRMPCEGGSRECVAAEVISCVHIFNGRTHLSDLGVLFWDENPDAPPALSTAIKDGQFGIQFRELYRDKIKEAIDSFLG
ncbi:hypothetical protein [Pedobacter sp.]